MQSAGLWRGQPGDIAELTDLPSLGADDLPGLRDLCVVELNLRSTARNVYFVVEDSPPFCE
jgi:hypothetical protein